MRQALQTLREHTRMGFCEDVKHEVCKAEVPKLPFK
jgi:hypothetical protein